MDVRSRPVDSGLAERSRAPHSGAQPGEPAQAPERRRRVLSTHRADQGISCRLIIPPSRDRWSRTCWIQPLHSNRNASHWGGVLPWRLTQRPRASGAQKCRSRRDANRGEFRQTFGTALPQPAPAVGYSRCADLHHNRQPNMARLPHAFPYQLAQDCQLIAPRLPKPPLALRVCFPFFLGRFCRPARSERQRKID